MMMRVNSCSINILEIRQFLILFYSRLPKVKFLLLNHLSCLRMIFELSLFLPNDWMWRRSLDYLILSMLVFDLLKLPLLLLLLFDYFLISINSVHVILNEIEG